MLQSYSGRRSALKVFPDVRNCQQRVDKYLEMGPGGESGSFQAPDRKMAQERAFKGTFLLIRLLSLKLRADLSWRVWVSP